MQKIMLAAFGLLTTGCLAAQSKEGKVVYERVSQITAHFNINGQENVVPQTRKSNFELSFSNNQALWKTVEQDNNDDNNDAGGDGVHIKMIVAGDNDVLFTNLETGKKTERREFMDKTFIVDDSVKAMKWKMGEETKTLLGHLCRKATTVSYSKKMSMINNNGNVERKEIQDTSNVIAWFTTDIPVSTGPAEYQGQLPGLILEMNIGDGKQVYTAQSVSPKVDLAEIKEPTGKKHYTPEQYRAEVNKMMEEMQKNMGGQGRNIRINN